MKNEIVHINKIIPQKINNIQINVQKKYSCGDLATIVRWISAGWCFSIVKSAYTHTNTNFQRVAGQEEKENNIFPHIYINNSSCS